MVEFFDHDKFNIPGSGIMDPVEHSVVEESWGAGLNRPDAAQLLRKMGVIPVLELIQRSK